MFKIKGDFVVIEMEFNTVAFSVCIAAYIELQLRAMVNVDVFVLDVGDSGVEHPHHAHHRIKATIQSVNSKHLHWLDTIFKRIIPCLLLYRPSVKHRTLNYLKFQIFPSNLYRHLRCRSLCGLFEAFVFVHGGHNAAADNGLMHCSRRTDTRHSDIFTLVYATPRHSYSCLALPVGCRNFQRGVSFGSLFYGQSQNFHEFLVPLWLYPYEEYR